MLGSTLIYSSRVSVCFWCVALRVINVEMDTPCWAVARGGVLSTPARVGHSPQIGSRLIQRQVLSLFFPPLPFFLFPASFFTPLGAFGAPHFYPPLFQIYRPRERRLPGGTRRLACKWSSMPESRLYVVLESDGIRERSNGP